MYYSILYCIILNTIILLVYCENRKKNMYCVILIDNTIQYIISYIYIYRERERDNRCILY